MIKIRRRIKTIRPKERKVKNLSSGRNSLNYSAFLSGWIEKAGVVPLLRLAAFLFFPILVFFAERRFFVTRVLDTITMLLTHSSFKYLRLDLCNNSRPLLLHRKLCSVKAVKPSSVLFYLAIVTMTLTSPAKALYASQHKRPIFLNVGQYKQLEVGKINRFLVTNETPLSYRYEENQGLIKLKGSSNGATELIVWKNSHLGEVKHRYQIRVYDESKEELSLGLNNVLKRLGLMVETKGPMSFVSGEITSFENYIHFQRLRRQFAEYFANNVYFTEASLSPKLIKKVISKAYAKIFNLSDFAFSCRPSNIQIQCFYDQSRPIPNSEKTYLTETLGIDISSHNRSESLSQNYRVKLKIIQEEQLDGRELSFGLNQLNATVDEIFQHGLRSLVEQNSILINQSNVSVSTLARPQITMIPLQESKISIGSELPFQSQSSLGVSNTEWKFAGLEVTLNLRPVSHRLKLDYSIEFSRPTPGNSPTISGNRESSTLYLEKNSATQLFEITYQTIGNGENGIPGIKRFPLIGSLFSSQSNQNTYKRITGHIKIEEI